MLPFPKPTYWMADMKFPTILASAALLGILAAPALAQPTDTQVMKESSPGKATAARTRTVVATVTEVDAAKGHVTLKGPKGREIPLQVGPEVRNLAQVKVGDKVTVKYLEALSLTLMKDGKAVVAANATDATARAPAGGLPGGAVAQQVEVTADVIGVDTKSQIVTLKGPKETVEMRVQDPKQLKLIKVGDQIQAVYTQALALSVQPLAAKAK
jgi:Cu/Ag efflux protein CusF